MKQTFRTLANARPTRYLESGTPTGLTGLWTHNSPRSALLFLYSSTLEKLNALPESSLYRQSVQATTKHRLALVDATVPPGYEAWQRENKELAKHLADNPEGFRVASGRLDGSEGRVLQFGGKTFVIRKQHEEGDIRIEEWDGEADEGPGTEGLRSEEERADQALLAKRRDMGSASTIRWQDEPQLTADQVSGLEAQIGAGLIEEVIQVAEGEHKLVDSMIQAKVWEDLEEKPAHGQWIYSDRNHAQ